MNRVWYFVLLTSFSLSSAATSTTAIPSSGVTPTSNIEVPSAVQQQANKQAVLAFYDAGLNQKDFAAASQYLGPDYKQHNPGAADGIEGFKHFISFLKEKVPTSHSEIKQAFVDGNFVILHVHKTTSPTDRGVAIVDIFRLEHGKIVEHWDVTQAIPEKTASGNAMF
ncbi:nuclear transport factor 2 family protein [Aquirhabdus sp.]|uniref:nuclear transport factor 2 family protein n=1 Tax=Aquirhabdus sp. TaxID=2824160 RepID=UPI00396C38D1